MNKGQSIKGFSKLSKEAKIEWLINEYLDGDESYIDFLRSYLHPDAKIQKLHDEFIENTITNYYLPLGIAPNFLINGKIYALPMAIEESSVVAAAAKSANFWLERGGFTTTVLSTTKIGHVHFMYFGDGEKLKKFIERHLAKFYEDTHHITANMQARGGGILSIALKNLTHKLEGYYQLEAKFETCDSMGANFINSCLEQMAKTLTILIAESQEFSESEKHVQIVMRILSNYTPECIVKAEVSCPIEQLNADDDITPQEFAEKFYRAVKIAEIEPYRATTHNKGIFNGIDAVVIATGNDFRAVEAAGHTYASRDGQYKSLTHCDISDGIFRFWIELPLALGVVGGLTSLHPMVRFSLALLGKPSATELMGIVAASGLAQNFAALRALVTSGIQKGHMKMHLLNILNQLEATEEEKKFFINYFKDKVVTYAETVRKFCELRGIPAESYVNIHHK
ncbi:hydroxymethylglutaryl-CoA reductase, degradative [Schleiferia thermophila]|jgi:hydroxymethylglutaryl-CoA reductase|uniref:3-hydroxy-3-methylglutaryl coenzyme A reductase n=1 Tax=Schleiferia thermophila TaxID=884107 RepID=A0A369A1M9_9FLAO|nr:hydroxymethylglutaryl-CoA reductase, degradative [Schleiferia thermophila]KFD38993.1 hydroxymethylglutaryl-CoA reductase [Schleiferia thermophila str. Yellowstone]RCX02338.1 3-hydroxy-3-methylglutaryl-coenzyme A reductase [Schleiferia thermophila]GCD80778.1 3-hydroxy-3-methylglutaryl coenzyme A reductase [Schleiferia thermophila]